MAPPRGRQDLLALLMPTIIGHKDEFGKEETCPLPLTFDRINEGRPFSRNFILARLPIELVWETIQLVPKADLDNLALVNRDCR